MKFSFYTFHWGKRGEGIMTEHSTSFAKTIKHSIVGDTVLFAINGNMYGSPDPDKFHITKIVNTIMRSYA